MLCIWSTISSGLRNKVQQKMDLNKMAAWGFQNSIVPPQQIDMLLKRLVSKIRAQTVWQNIERRQLKRCIKYHALPESHHLTEPRWGRHSGKCWKCMKKQEPVVNSRIWMKKWIWLAKFIYKCNRQNWLTTGLPRAQVCTWWLALK